MPVPNVKDRQTQKAIACDAKGSAAKLQAVRLRECKIGVCTHWGTWYPRDSASIDGKQMWNGGPLGDLLYIYLMQI